MHNGIQSIDHPVIAARDLSAARRGFEELGFTVPPRGSHVEWGTGNLCIMFPDDYLEVRGIIDASRFTMHLDEHLENYGEGLMGVAFGTSDVHDSHARASANGIDVGELRHLTRNFEHPDGWTKPSFELYAPAASDIDGLMHVVVIQHLTPELIRRRDFLEHANGCIGVNAMAGTVTDINASAKTLCRLLGNDGVELTGPELILRLPSDQQIVLQQGSMQRLVSVTLRVRDLKQLRDLLDARGVQTMRQDNDHLVVDGVCGSRLQFTEALPG